MGRVSLDRRTVLKGLLGSTVVSVALPPLDIFMNDAGTAYASGEIFPLRFGMFFWGNGTRPEKWVPTGEGEGDNWTLSEELAPLERHKHTLCVVSGMRVMIPNNLPHWSGAAGILAGHPGEGRDNSFYMTRPTIDQTIARGMENELNQFARFRSIEYGAESMGHSYSGNNVRNPAENSPKNLFNRIFTDGFRAPDDSGEPDPELAMRRSVLDAVLEQGKKLNQQLGANDRRRLEQHFEGIRELEARIQFIEDNPITFDACFKPNAPHSDYPMIEGRPQLAARNEALNEVMKMAVACGQTNVFSNWITSPVNNLLIDDIETGHHVLTHEEPLVNGTQQKVHKIVVKLMEEYASMLDSFASVEEGDGTLLDHCLILGTSDVSEGRLHALDEFPIVLAGGANGRVKQNYHYRSSTQENVSNFNIALQQVLGLSATEFGEDEAYSNVSLDIIKRNV